MTAEEFNYGAPRVEARLVPIQRLKHAGALAMHHEPLRIGAIVDNYRSRFESAFGVTSRNQGSKQEAYARLHVEDGLRSMISRLIGYRSIPVYYHVIQKVLTDTDAGRNAIPSAWSPVTAYLTPNEQALNDTLDPPPSQGIIAVRDATFNTFSADEQIAIGTAYTQLAKTTKSATTKLLDVAYTQWRKLTEEVIENPFESDLPTEEIELLAKLSLSENVRDVVLNASTSAVIGTLATLSELHTASAVSGCPQEERWKLTYANLRKLGIFAQISSKEALHTLAELSDPDHANMFIVNQDETGMWQVDFSNSYFKKVYNRYDVANCQGATEIYPLDESALKTMERVHEQITRRAGNNPMDIQFNGTTSAAEMGTLLVVSYVERDGINLIHQKSK
jgi:hypothetical protein